MLLWPSPGQLGGGFLLEPLTHVPAESPVTQGAVAVLSQPPLGEFNSGTSSRHRQNKQVPTDYSGNESL